MLTIKYMDGAGQVQEIEAKRIIFITKSGTDKQRVFDVDMRDIDHPDETVSLETPAITFIG
jgi:siroheme synthase